MMEALVLLIIFVACIYLVLGIYVGVTEKKEKIKDSDKSLKKGGE